MNEKTELELFAGLSRILVCLEKFKMESRMLRIIPTIILVLLMLEGVLAQSTATVPENDTQLWTEVQITKTIVKDKIDLILTGTFRLGRNVTHPVDERVAIAIDFKLNKYFKITPGYLYQAAQPFAGRKTYENRLMLAGTLEYQWKNKITLKDRNMIERRLRNSQADSTRYRNQVRVDFPFSIISAKDKKHKFFVADEVFYDWSVNAWTRNRFSVGMNRTFKDKKYTGEIFYMRQNDGRARPGDLNVVGVSLKIKLD